MKNKRNTRRGFTLIELLVVVLIIGILAAVAVPQYQFAVEKSRLAGAMTKVASLQKAIDVWVLENEIPTGPNPTYFLGGNADIKDAFDIDVTSSMDCPVDELYCEDENFRFSVSCGGIGECAVSIERLFKEGTPAYVTGMNRNAAGVWTGGECVYDDDSPVYAEKICKYLEAQGNGFTACYEC